MYLRTAENVYNETLRNIAKFELFEDYLDELQFSYDAVIYYIASRLEIEMSDNLFGYINTCFINGVSWNECYEDIYGVD